MVAVASHVLRDTSVAASRPCATRSRRTSRGARELGGACCAYLPRREGRRPLGWCSEQGDGRALGAGHDGRRPLGHQGPGGDDARDRPLARLAGLRRAGRHVLAGVRAERQGEDHRAPAPRAPGGSVRLRRTGRSQRGREPRPTGGGDGPSQAGVGAGHATGLSRADPRVLRRRAAAAGRSPASHPGAVLSGRDCDASWRGRSTSGCPKRSRTRVSPPFRLPGIDQDADRVPPGATPARGAESPFEHLPRAHREPGYVGLPR